MTPALFQSAQWGDLRTFDVDGEPWFAAADICRALGIGNVSMATSGLDGDEKGITTTDTLGGRQQIVMVTESGLYAIAFQSRKPEAKEFRKWVTSEVLPALRKTGSYSVTTPKTYVEALEALVIAEKSRLALESQNEEMAPKAEFYDAVTASDDLCQLATVAQVLGLPYGRTSLFQKLRNMGVLISGGERHNQPKQSYVGAGYFTVKESKYLADDKVNISFTTYATQKGMAWLQKKLAA